MKVVIDSNIFISDYYMAGTGFGLLREGLHLIPADLKVPEVVLDEVVNRFQEELTEALGQFDRAEGKLRRLTKVPASPPLTFDDIPEKVDEYRDWLKAQLTELGAEVLPYPDVPHKQVVMRDLARKSPFKQGGAGYRDYLIWQCVLSQIGTGQDRLVLLTANKSDFGEGPRVSIDLLEDFGSPQDVEVIPSLKHFNEAHIIPRLAVAEELKTKLQAHSVDFFDIPAWLHQHLVVCLRGEAGLETLVLGFPQDVGSLWPTALLQIGGVVIDRVLALSEDRILVKTTVRAMLEFSLYVDWDEYEQHEEVREFVGRSEYFDGLERMVTSVLTLGFSFVLSAGGRCLVGSELEWIQGPHASVDWSSW